MYYIYISTPINARVETTFDAKLAGALDRIDAIRKIIDEKFPNPEQTLPLSTFDVNPIGLMTEEEAMARCIHAVLKSDAIVLDDGWENSNGCQLEAMAAKLYGKNIFTLESLKKIPS